MGDEQKIIDAIVAKCSPQDKCPNALGIELVEVRPGFAKANMVVRDDMLNFIGTCHGGMLMTLADTTFAYASLSRNLQGVAQDLSINFVKPGKAGDTITAIAEERSRGKRTGVYDITLTNSKDEVIALLRGKSFVIGGKIITEEEI